MVMFIFGGKDGVLLHEYGSFWGQDSREFSSLGGFELEALPWRIFPDSPPNEFPKLAKAIHVDWVDVSGVWTVSKKSSKKA